MSPTETSPPRTETSAPSLGATIDASFEMLGNLLGNAERLVTSVRRDSAQIVHDSQELARVATARADLMRGVARAAPRMMRIVGDGLNIIARYKVHASRARHLDDARQAETLEALHRDSAERLYRLCVELRGGVLKLGQFLSARMDVLPPAYVEVLSRLQDRVPALPYDDIADVIEAELEAPIANVFAVLDPEPLAAASLAQVHRAVLADGTAVAVKVQVPGTRERVEADLAALRIIAAATDELPIPTDLDTILAELSKSIRRELDFRTEAAELSQFAEAFEGATDIVVPKVIESLSSSRVLTMELVEGQRLTEFLDQASPDDRDRIFTSLIGAYCAQVLRHGRFQADPHPGNFLVLPGPRLALLDFGCVGHLSAEQIAAYKEIAIAILAQDTGKVATLLGRAGFATRDGNPDTLVVLAELMLKEFREGASDWSRIDPRAQIERAMKVMRSNPVVHVPEEFVLLGRVFGTLGGLVMHYQPNIDLFALIAPHLV